MIRKIKIQITILIAALFFYSPAYANTIDKQVIIQPIQITDGTTPFGNQDMLLFEKEMDKIWSQAGIDIEFNPFTQYNSPGDSSISYDELAGYYSGGFIGPGTYHPPTYWTAAQSDPSAAADPFTINMWFTDTITSPVGDILGISNFIANPDGSISLGANGVVIANGVFDDPAHPLFAVLAHELGHNLGLFHIDDSAWPTTTSENARNLMSRYMLHADSIDDIYPDGEGRNRLDQHQIDLARNSPFVRDYSSIPEPATIILFSIGLLGLIGVSRQEE